MLTKTSTASLLLLILILTGATSAGAPEPLVPKPIESNPTALLTAARKVAPVRLRSGYRQYDLTIARVGTWERPRDLRMRLLLPPGKMDRPVPVVAYVHGGGFIGGTHEMKIHSKRSGFARCLRGLLDDGVAVASLDYRLCREAGWPAPIRDTLTGLRFLSLHGSHWGLDGDRLAVCGHSAGARIAGLLAMVPRDQFHEGNLPWQNGGSRVRAAWLWAGSAWEVNNVQAWTNFGKPKQYSVPRMLFGEHPATNMETRQRLRLRHSLPHLSKALPPITLLRGKSDYGGDHSDARQAVSIWKALGNSADLSLVANGHNAAGPTKPFVAFMKKHLGPTSEMRPRPDPLGTAEALLDANQPAAALEVLAASQDADSNRPSGRWLILDGGQCLWLADHREWTQDARRLVLRARKTIARLEAAAARRRRRQRSWFAAQQAALNVKRLCDDDRMNGLIEEVLVAAREESTIFRALAKANRLWHAGRKDSAIAILRGRDDRLVDARKRLTARPSLDGPSWASRCGVDVYGQWADLSLCDGNTIRMRYVAPGKWTLPERLKYRNRASQPRTRSVEVTNGFWLAETETTIGQWYAVKIDGRHEPNTIDTPSRPATGMSYQEIVAWTDILELRHKGVTFRLPSEAHWLHAATGGRPAHVRGPLDLHAVHALSSRTAPGPKNVDSVLPDLGGFRGMIGGVQEWTSSPGHNQARFQGPGGKFLVWGYPIARGGSWASMPHCLGLHVRRQQRHTNRQGDLGFRLMISANGKRDWLDELKQE